MKKYIILLILFGIASISSAHELPERFITVKLSQSRVSLNVWKHAKDAMNATEMKIPVSERCYNEINVGDDLVDKRFRWGSFMIGGSTSSWSMKVISK